MANFMATDSINSNKVCDETEHAWNETRDDEMRSLVMCYDCRLQYTSVVAAPFAPVLHVMLSHAVASPMHVDDV